MHIFVNLENLKDNILKIREYTQKDIIAVVKSNAYGLGASHIINSLKKVGVTYFFFNKLSEYLEVNELLKDCNVLIFESLSINNINKYYKSNIILTINSYNDLLEYRKYKNSLRVHLQVDTGMNRCGIRSMDETLSIIQDLPSNILLEGIYTHYASGLDEYEYFTYQQTNFLKYLKLYDFKIIHSNATSSLHKNIVGNMVRVGIGMYGYHTKLKLKKVVSGTTKLLNIFDIEKDTKVGYLGKYVSKEKERIGVVDIGYYDSNIINKVYFGNNVYNFIGKTCMNHAFIKIDNKINCLSRLRILEEFDIIVNDEYDYYKLLTSFDHLKKNYIERI